MLRRLHVAALQLFGRLPRPVRRAIVRSIAPKFTVGAVCVIERSDGSILLVRQSYRHHWGLPGGLLKRRERAEDGARREVREEVGIDVALVGEPAVVVHARHHRVDVIFRASAPGGTSGDEIETNSAEIVEARWFPAAQLPDLQVEASAAIVALARAGRPHAA